MFALPVKIAVDIEGKQWELRFDGSTMLTIGRAPDCDIVVDSTRASRYHAEILGEIVAGSGFFTIADNGSSNGIRVNGEAVKRHSLVPGDVIQVGPAMIRFGEAAAGSARPEVASAAVATEYDDDETRGLEGVAPATPAGRAVPAGRTAATPRRQPAASTPPLPPPPAPERVTTPTYKKRSPLPALVGTFLVVIVLGGVAWFAVDYVEQQRQQRELAGGSQSQHSGEVTEITPVLPETGIGHTELRDLLTEAERKQLGWEVIERLELLEQSHPNSSAAQEAKRLRVVLSGIRAAVLDAEESRANEIIDALVSERRFGEAVMSLRYLSRASVKPKVWNARLLAVQSEARAEFLAIEKDLGERIEQGQGEEALALLVQARDRFGGTEIYEDLLPRFVDEGLRVRRRDSWGTNRSSAVLPLEEMAATAFDACKFRDMVPLYYQVLSLDPSPTTRIQALENLVDAFYLQRMLEEFLQRATENPINVNLSKTYQGRVVSADAVEVEHEVEVAGRSVLRKQLWAKIPEVKKAALFSAVKLSSEGNLGLAIYCNRIGFRGGSHRALLRLHKVASSRALAAAALARFAGVPIPAGGFVEHRGRLVSLAEREAEIAARALAKEEEKARIEELKAGNLATKLSRYIEHAVTLRSDGHYESAQRILNEIVARKDLRDTPAGSEAQRLIDDPFLRKEVMVDSGPSENRLDIGILGDGFLVDDDQQERFIGYANSCKHLLLSEQPYRDYQSYINFFAVNLGSKEEGLSTGADRGDVSKDTALGGKIEWGVITMNNSKVMGVLDRLGGTDNVAVCIGNDFADVATGGGGVASLSKASMTPVGHELGHALGGLHDEYDSPAGSDPDRPVVKKRETNVPISQDPPNLMRGSDRDGVLAQACWNAWIEAGEEKWWNGAPVGVYEGGGYSPFNVWRPQANCKMRNASANFCVVCMEVMVLAIYRYVRPIDRVEPSDPFVALKDDQRQVFKVWPMKPETHFLEARWTLLDLGATTAGSGDTGSGSDSGRTGVDEENLEGEIFRRVGRTFDAEGRVVEVAELRAKNMRPGRYRLRVEVRDPTPWVLNDPQGLLKDRRDWQIIIP